MTLWHGIAHFYCFGMVFSKRKGRDAKREATDEFILWWTTTRPTLVRYARALGLTQYSADDLIQEVALSLIRDCNRIDSLDQFRAFAFRRLGWLRFADIQRRSHEVAFDEDLHDIPAEIPDPFTEQIHLELARAITSLPESQRRVLEGILRGQSTTELAASLGISDATVRSHSRHARLALAEALSDFVRTGK